MIWKVVSSFVFIGLSSPKVKFLNSDLLRMRGVEFSNIASILKGHPAEYMFKASYQIFYYTNLSNMFLLIIITIDQSSKWIVINRLN